MLHPSVACELVGGEADVATERLAGRCVVTSHGTCVHATLASGHVIALDGARYDAEPFAVSVIDGDHCVAPHERWPGTLSGGVHPIVGRPFACIRGTAEYHCHPSHLTDLWDLHRGHIQLVDLLGHLLNKTGA